MNRTVIVQIPDDDTDRLTVLGDMRKWVSDSKLVSVDLWEQEIDPVPSDDQLTRDLDSLTAFVQGALASMIQVGGDSKGMVDYADMATRIRVAAGLEES